MYSQFCYHIQKDEQKRRASMHINRKPGEQVEIDWAGDPAHKSETMDFENDLPQSSSVMFSIFLVETPLMTISIMERTRACSLRWYLSNMVVLKLPFLCLGTRSVRVPTLVVSSLSLKPLR
jgi:hypothetical protein